MATLGEIVMPISLEPGAIHYVHELTRTPIYQAAYVSRAYVNPPWVEDLPQRKKESKSLASIGSVVKPKLP